MSKIEWTEHLDGVRWHQMPEVACVSDLNRWRIVETFKDKATAERVVALRDQLAYEAAYCMVESSSVHEEGCFLDTTVGLNDNLGAAFLVEVLEYLDLIGVLERHPMHDGWVKILQQPGASSCPR